MQCADGHNSDPHSPVWMFRNLARARRIANNKLLEHFGIREIGQPLILFVLECNCSGGAVSTQKELADILGISPATITISIKSLEKRGLIRKVCDETDMRCNRIEITDSGREVSAKFRETFRALDEAMYTGFTLEELSLAASFFVRMTDNLLQFAEVSEEGGTSVD